MTPLDVMRRHPFFTLPPTAMARDWIERGHNLRLPTGETIFQEGSPGNWAYLLLQGRVRVLRRTPSGRDVTLGSLEPGELFGEYALLSPGLNTATCRAASDVELLQVPLGPVRDWIQQIPFVKATIKNWLQLHFLLRFLRGQAFLGFLSAGSALAMYDHLNPITVPALRTIQAEGLCEEQWFFVEHGEVLLSADEAPLRSVVPGECFGEDALRKAGGLPVAVALAPTRCLSLGREFFLRPNQPAGPRGVQSYPGENLAAPSRVQWIGQRDAADCGPASLAMIAHYFGVPCLLEELRARMHVGPRGCALVDMLQAAWGLSLVGQAARISPSQLGFVKVPAIAHLTSGHYVVLFRISLTGIWMGDPATGLVNVSVAHFVSSFSGYVLLLHRAQAVP